MPKHEDMDFPHQAIWCIDCHKDSQRSQQLLELRRSNDLKQEHVELWARQQYEEYGPQPVYRPAPPPPPVQEHNINGRELHVKPRSINQP